MIKILDRVVNLAVALIACSAILLLGYATMFVALIYGMVRFTNVVVSSTVAFILEE